MILREYLHGTFWESYPHVEPGLSQIAYEAWERMTDGGVGGAEGVHSLGQDHYMARGDYRWVSQITPDNYDGHKLSAKWTVYLVSRDSA